MALPYRKSLAYRSSTRYGGASSASGLPYRKAYSYRSSKPYGGRPQVLTEPWGLDRWLQQTLHPWLASRFDGQTHEVAGQARLFPLASFSFDRSDIPQPLSPHSVSIRWISETEGSREYRAASGGEMFLGVRWTVVVQAFPSAGPGGNAAYLCRLTADLLRAMLLDPVVASELEREGITNLGGTVPRLLDDEMSHARIFTVTGQVNRTVAQATVSVADVPVVGIQAGQGLETVWHGWLTSWFDGAEHAFGQGTFLFPAVHLGVGRHDLPQPLATPAIAIAVRSDPVRRPEVRLDGDGSRWVRDRMATTLTIRAGGFEPRRAAYESRRVADLLHALLLDRGATAALARGGVFDLEVQKPDVLPDPNLVSRSLRVLHAVDFDTA